MTNNPCRYAEGPLLSEPAALDVQDLASEEVEHLAGARVMIAEYDVLQHDFPALRTESLVLSNPHLQDMSAPEREACIRSIIDEWLIANAAYTSMAQASQQVVNTLIATDGRRSIAYRPPRYGRSIVVPVDWTQCASSDGRWRWPALSGLLDLKGAGVAPDKVPVNGVQSNGLEYLGLALTDFLVKKAIDAVFARALPTAWTVPVYAVLDLGFDIIAGYHGCGEAGMHVRRAHRRRLLPKAPTIEHKVTFDIESVLRRYGLTAATRDLQLHVARVDGNITWQTGVKTPRRIKDPDKIGTSLALLRDVDAVTFDRRDVQLAREVNWPPAEAQMVDFGAIRIEPRFDCPLVRDYDGPTLHEILWPSDAGFIQPDPDLQLPVETWNRYVMKSFCFNLASEFRRGTMSAEEVRCALDDQLSAWLQRWPTDARRHVGRPTPPEAPNESCVDAVERV